MNNSFAQWFFGWLISAATIDPDTERALSLRAGPARPAFETSNACETATQAAVASHGEL